VRVAFFPNHRGWNPYLDLLEAGLAGLGVEVVDAPRLPYRDWLGRREADVLHLHWLHVLYRGPDLRSSLAGAARLVAQLTVAKRAGYRVVWTVHNLRAHDGRYGRLDRWVTGRVAWLADAVLVHCSAAAAALAAEHGRRHGVLVAPHGHYIGAYPDRVTRDEARAWLGLGAGETVFLYLGQLRPYKGLSGLVDAFAALPAPEARLVVAGRLHHKDPGEAAGLLAALASEPRAVVREGWVADDDLQRYFRAADVAVCPFESVLTSGSAVLAMSFGRPVVAPSLGCLPELVVPGSGRLYDPDRPGALRSALAACLDDDLGAKGDTAREVAAGHTWERTAEVVRRAYVGS
jgi:glycosyltransferase involved in cell wall biosynthesis